MSDTPRETPEEVLDRVMSQSLPPEGDGPDPEVPAPEAPPVAEPSPTPPEAGAKPAAPPKAGRRTSVYLYLLVLFGAAFMLLLLAYFVQQRSSETTISDLRDTMNLSRTELMEEIDGLKAEQEQLEALLQAAADAQAKAEEERDALEEQLRSEERHGIARYWEAHCANTLALLERFCAERDWLMAAVAVEQMDFTFSSANPNYQEGSPQNANPAQSARFLELRDSLEEDGYVTILGVGDTQRAAAADSFWADPAVMSAAQKLWSIFCGFPSGSGGGSSSEVADFYRDSANLDALDGRAFRPSTVALLEQIKAYYIARGDLVEQIQEDGSVILTQGILSGGTD